jgi:hypothetical protein
MGGNPEAAAYYSKLVQRLSRDRGPAPQAAFRESGGEWQRESGSWEHLPVFKNGKGGRKLQPRAEIFLAAIVMEEPDATTEWQSAPFDARTAGLPADPSNDRNVWKIAEREC